MTKLTHSTDGSMSGNISVDVLDDHQKPSFDQNHYLDSKKNHDINPPFNLRDRKNISFNKKQGGFVYYKNEEEQEDSQKFSEENNPLEQSNEEIQLNNQPKSLYVEELSDEDFKPK